MVSLDCSFTHINIGTYNNSFMTNMCALQDEYVTMSPVFLSNSLQTSHSDEGSAVNDVNTSSQNTVADVDLHHTDALPALTEGLDLDQIYTETDVDPFQESIYQIVDKMSD